MKRTLKRNEQASEAETQRARAARDAVVVKFDRCLLRVGFDYRSGDLWLKYVSFVKQWPHANVSPHESGERQKMLRYIFQLAVSFPTKIVDQLWQQYEHFEKHEVENNVRS